MRNEQVRRVITRARSPLANNFPRELFTTGCCRNRFDSWPNRGPAIANSAMLNARRYYSCLTADAEVFTAPVNYFAVISRRRARYRRITAKGTQLNFGINVGGKEERAGKRDGDARGASPLGDYANISLVPKLPSRSRHEEQRSNTQRASYRRKNAPRDNRY